jgi:hypothetical protein
LQVQLLQLFLNRVDELDTIAGALVVEGGDLEEVSDGFPQTVRIVEGESMVERGKSTSEASVTRSDSKTAVRASR